MPLESNIKLAAEAVNKFGVEIRVAIDTWRRFVDVYREYGMHLEPVALYPNKRCAHLAKHAKKFRTRKKNQARALYI